MPQVNSAIAPRRCQVLTIGTKRYCLNGGGMFSYCVNQFIGFRVANPEKLAGATRVGVGGQVAKSADRARLPSFIIQRHSIETAFLEEIAQVMESQEAPYSLERVSEILGRELEA